MVANYLEKVYAGLIGMNAGIRLGAPVEPDAWTYERIKRVFGDLTDYVKAFKIFAADDDANGPYFLGRALLDDARDREMEAGDVAKAWLNYAREGVGLFWWGGYGVSSSHTAYMNLKRGIPAPRSGSAEQNGLTLAEQIGGQIFIDTYGFIFPGNIQKAAGYARISASVSHDKNALEGAAFIAACISQAFISPGVEDIIAAGLRVIDPVSTYARVVNAVIDFHREHPERWELCRQYLEDHWGYDKYPGACHIIPNAGVCILALLYSAGDFNRGIELSTMCGWDTDSTSGSIGSILGVARGLEGIRDNYRAPINDRVVMSGISGSLNIVDLPTYAGELAWLGYRRAGETPPPALGPETKDIRFGFDLPGATHGFSSSDTYYCTLKQTFETARSGAGSLEVFFDALARGRKSKIYYKPFYRRDDFSDERYMPVFSPRAYPGQRAGFFLKAERWAGEGIFIQPYVRNTTTRKDILIGGVFLRGEDWTEISFTIPDLAGDMIDEIGFMVEGDTPATKGQDLGRLFLDDFTVTGKAAYSIDISRQKREFASIIPFSHNHGSWNIEAGRLHAMSDSHAEAMTGNYLTGDVEVSGRVEPACGGSHLLSARVQGALRGYYAGFDGQGRVSILCNDSGLNRLASVPFDWEMNREYNLIFIAQGSSLKLLAEGKLLLETEDSRFVYGMVGYAKYDPGRTFFGNLRVREL
jgi:ADP-ribosylglycohydrolase